jgi:DNA-binding CsgD family transcriptional regulator
LSLSPREREVLEVLARGMSTKQIASILGISYETVCVHLRRIYKKLNVRSRTEAVVKHLRARTITPEDPEIFEEFAETGKTSYLSKAK